MSKSRSHTQQTASSKRAAFRFRPQVERLETRLAPAILVTTPFDEVVNDGLTSLREAINQINSSFVSRDNTILLPAGLYRITLRGSMEDNNDSGDFDIKRPVTIQGAGAGATVIDGNGLDRVFHFQLAATPAAYSATISGVTIQNGVGDGTAGGGGIRVTDTSANRIALTVNDSIIQNNRAPFSDTNGGGIAVRDGNLTINRCTITNNLAERFGGGISSDGGDITIASSTISNNVAVVASGGGVFANGARDVNLTGCAVLDNSAAFGGGGIDLIGSGHGTITNSIVRGNHGVSGGGIRCADTGVVTISGSAITNNFAIDSGGGLAVYTAADFSMSRCTVVDNVAGSGNGGGLYLDTSSSFTLVNLTISGNVAGAEGGGIFRTNTGMASLNNVTVAYNYAVSGGGIVSAGSGLTLANTIVARNAAVSGTPQDVDSKGVAGNLIDGGGNFIGNNGGASSSFAPSATNTHHSQVGTLVSPINPLLGPLQDNGGDVVLPDGSHLLTHMPLADSSLVNRGVTDSIPRVDERGVPHITSSLDIGAVQTVKVAFAISAADNQVYANLFHLNGTALAAWTLVAPGQFTAFAVAGFGPGGDNMLLGLGLDHQIYGARIKPDGRLAFGWFLIAPGQFTSLVADTVGASGGSFPIVFGLGTNGQVYGARLSAEGTLLNGWFLVAPGQFSSLAAGQYGAGNPILIGLGTDHQAYAARFDTSGTMTNGWFLVAPGLFSSVTVGSRRETGPELLGVGLDQRIYAASFGVNGMLQAGWFATTGPVTFASVTAVTLTTGDVVAFGLATNQQIYQGEFSEGDGSQLRDWGVNAPGLFTALSAGVHAGGNVELLAVGGDGRIYGELFSEVGGFLSGFFPIVGAGFRAILVGL